MAHVDANGIRLEYEEFGKAEDKPLLLIMGLGAQMVRWDDALCELFASSGFRAIRFDNRDVGLSTKFIAECPDPRPLLMDLFQGKSVTPPYTLDDMADDVAGLMEALAIPAAHVAGASMGGMIAQLVALRYPKRVLTLTSIMSTTGEPELPQGDPAVLGLLAQPMPTEREAAIEFGVKAWQLLAGGGFPFDEGRVRGFTALEYDRDSDPTAMGRQMLAIMTAPGRREALRSLTLPALVIHGGADPLVPIAGGFDTADSIPNAKMLVIEGMGHELPEGAWPEVVDAIAALAREVN
jgi:pimeloyl-ACP methyl ester carboxylesterase